MAPSLRYTPFEPCHAPRPVDRLAWIEATVRGRRVLDLGCYDETAISKFGTDFWLHGRIASVSASVVGLDNSAQIPDKGFWTPQGTLIHRGDVTNPETLRGVSPDAEIIVAGELIEHLPDTLAFFSSLKSSFPGRVFIATTPNTTSLTNGLLALTGRESCHVDHLQVYSFKTLNTLCRLAGFETWTLYPYHVRYTEFALGRSSASRNFITLAERTVNAMEWLFPLTAGGWILHVETI